MVRQANHRERRGDGMADRWVRRKAHRRSARTGGTTLVRATWELRPERAKQKTQAYRHPCPDCGALVVSVRMKRGGWAHFEGGMGLGGIKHACFHRGEGLGRRRDDDTPDMFGPVSPDSDSKR